MKRKVWLWFTVLQALSQGELALLLWSLCWGSTYLEEILKGTSVSFRLDSKVNKTVRTAPHSLSPPEKRTLGSSRHFSHNIHRKMVTEVQRTSCGSHRDAPQCFYLFGWPAAVMGLCEPVLPAYHQRRHICREPCSLRSQWARSF